MYIKHPLSVTLLLVNPNKNKQDNKPHWALGARKVRGLMNREAETHHTKLQFYGQELWSKKELYAN